MPLLQELAGGTRALETRLEELSRQSLFAREMLEREAVRWEQQHLGFPRHDDAQSALNTDQSKEWKGTAVFPGLVDGTAEGAQIPLSVRREEFPLLPFLKTGGASGQGGTGGDLPELVREELLHRFLLGESGTRNAVSKHTVVMISRRKS